MLKILMLNKYLLHEYFFNRPFELPVTKDVTSNGFIISLSHIFTIVTNAFTAELHLMSYHINDVSYHKSLLNDY